MTDFLHGAVAEIWREQRDGAEGLKDHKETNASTPEGFVSAGVQAPSTCDFESAEAIASIPAWKRILDVTFVIATAPVWLPLMLLLMLAVRLSSPGPIFYRQARVGFMGRKFMIYKFRSMKVDAETHVHEAHFERLMKESVPMVKLDGAGDPRILPWGRLMRATGLDELPQIFNVVRGEMSLVGPRPCTLPEFSRYARWQRERVNAPPGLTGYWQVNGKNRTTFNEMIDMDIHYSKNMSLGLDLKIILQTLPALLDQTLDTFSGSRSSSRGSFSSQADNRGGV